MNLIIKVLIGTLLIVNAFALFKSTPDVKFYSSSTPTNIKILPNQAGIVVGFSSGMVKFYNMLGNSQYTTYSHSYKIIDIQIIAGYVITLDSNGTAIRWSNYGINLGTWYVGSSVIDMSVTSTSYSYYVAFNLGSSVREYYATSYDTLVKTYFPQAGTSFTRIQYGTGYGSLFVGTNTSYVQVYSCSSGTYMYYSTYVYNPPIAFSLMSNNYVAELSASSSNYNYLYKTTAYASYNYLGSINASTTMVVCPNTNLIVTAQKYYADMAVYDQSGSYKQYLQYMSGTVQSMDCSTSYIVAVDSYGYVSINTYQGSPVDISGFPGWAIGLIVAVGVLIIAAAVIIKCVKAKRARAANGINNYNQIDNQIPPPQPYFPSNQGYNPNPINPAGQGYNPNVVVNPGYNANGPYSATNLNPNPYPGQNTNPYGSNQPRNWS